MTPSGETTLLKEGIILCVTFRHRGNSSACGLLNRHILRVYPHTRYEHGNKRQAGGNAPVLNSIPFHILIFVLFSLLLC
jgi:hypothetical protein